MVESRSTAENDFNFSTDADFQKLLESEVNRALVRGGLALFILGMVGLGGIFIMMALGARNLEGPVVLSVMGASFSALVYVLARRELMYGWKMYAVILPFIALPNLFFLGCELFLPAGAATFLTGPLGYLNIHLIFLTGFIFNYRLSIAAGLIGGGGYILAALAGADQIALASHPDPALHQDLTFLPVYIIKGVMMALGGPMVGAISHTARRLIFKGIREEREKNAVHRIFGQYVSPEVRDRIIHGGEGGERQEVTVLFSDLRGFSTYSEHADPGELVARLNEYFDRMVSAIEQEGGTVDKFVGDAVMAVFGGLIPVHNPAACAFRAALSMDRNLRELNAIWRAQGKVEFQNGIGLHRGDVLMGALGSQNRKEFTVMGDTVNTASRLEGYSKRVRHRLLLSERVYAELPADLKPRCELIGTVRLKGRTGAVQVYGALPKVQPVS